LHYHKKRRKYIHLHIYYHQKVFLFLLDRQEKVGAFMGEGENEELRGEEGDER
jgi:hypothetical protein